MNIKPLKKAISIAGGQTSLGRLINVPQVTISWWLHRSKKVPAEYAIPIENAVNGAVTRHELRPDIYPEE